MQLSARLIDEDEASRVLRAGSHIEGDVESIRTALAAERIRAVLATPGASTTGVALATQIRDSVASFVDIKFLRHTGDRGGRSFARTVLASLCLSGDIVEVDSVYRSSYTRLINVSPREDHALVIGGAPTPIIEAALGTAIRSIGIARIVERKSLSREIRADGQHWQAVHDWLGSAEMDLSLWTRRLMAEVITSGTDGGPLGLESLEALVIENMRCYWKALNSLRDIIGVSLCRAREPDRAAKWRYFVASFIRRAGEVAVQRSMSVSENVARRLQFGIASSADSPITFNAVRDGDRLFVKGIALIPYPEKRILALSQRVRANGVALHYVFPASLLMLLEHSISTLDARLSVREATIDGV